MRVDETEVASYTEAQFFFWGGGEKQGFHRIKRHDIGEGGGKSRDSTISWSTKFELERRKQGFCLSQEQEIWWGRLNRGSTTHREHEKVSSLNLENSAT